MAHNLVDPLQATLSPIKGDISHISHDLLCNILSYKCTRDVNIDITPEFKNIYELVNQDDDEQELYFYHGDHLGSSSWITDASGSVNQYLAYMPFGESFIDQRQTGHDIRFKFTGKERDAETGYTYFGARYYASDLSIWLSVDALSDKYLSTSPYMYVLGNPLNIIDPNGDSAFVLTAPKGAKGAGHMAMLIQNTEGKWALWSKNGTNESSEATGPNDKGDDNGKGTAYDSPQAFLDSKDNPTTEEGKREYTEGYIVAANEDQDREMEAGFKTELDKEYNVATSNCAQAVQSALKNAGFNTGRYDSEKYVPNYLKQGPSLGDIVIDRVPNLIYGRIKRQNPGGATYKAKPPSVKKAYIPRKTKHI